MVRKLVVSRQQHERADRGSPASNATSAAGGLDEDGEARPVRPGDQPPGDRRMAGRWARTVGSGPGRGRPGRHRCHPAGCGTRRDLGRHGGLLRTRPLGGGRRPGIAALADRRRSSDLLEMRASLGPARPDPN
jgi:hypothetical protein